MYDMTLPSCFNIPGSISQSGVTMQAYRSIRLTSTSRRGLSLIELAIGSTVAAVIMIAAGSALNLMTRGATGLQASSRLTMDGGVAMARMRREIGQAITSFRPIRFAYRLYPSGYRRRWSIRRDRVFLVRHRRGLADATGRQRIACLPGGQCRAVRLDL